MTGLRFARGQGGQRGAVTAELAVLMPAVVLVLLAVLGAGSAALAQVRCTDAARTGALLAARAEPSGVVLAAIRAVAPPGAVVTVTSSGPDVVVGVRAEVLLPLPGRPGVPVTARSVSRRESSWQAAG